MYQSFDINSIDRVKQNKKGKIEIYGYFDRSRPEFNLLSITKGQEIYVIICIKRANRKSRKWCRFEL